MEEKSFYRPNYGFDKGFTLSNCLLYYLQWYNRSGDYWADLRECLEADGFCGRAFSEWEIVSLVINVANEWNMYAANHGYKLIPINALLIPDYEISNWERLTDNHPEWLALVWKLLGIFAFDYERTELRIKKPHFSKKNTLKPYDYKKGVTYTKANRDVEKFKNWA